MVKVNCKLLLFLKNIKDKLKRKIKKSLNFYFREIFVLIKKIKLYFIRNNKKELSG